MKPVKLTIEGINSFISPQTIDFEAAGRSNLFCICGKTGAGKTTIFDSIMLALYGQCGKGNLADVVNLSLMTGRVALEFTEGGDRYTAERVIKCRFEKDGKGKRTDRRTATSDCMLYKNGAPIAKGGDATEILSGIVGLDAAEFKNVYLLEQGEYADFLKKSPAKQTEAVGKIFSLMRFGDVHKRATDAARAEQTEINRLLRDVGELETASPEKLQDEKQALAALRTKTTLLCKDVEARSGEIAELEKQRDAFMSAQQKQLNVKSLMLQADEAKKREYEAKTKLDGFNRTVDRTDAEKLKQKRDELTDLSALNALDRELEALEKQTAAKRAAADNKNLQKQRAEAAVDEIAAHSEQAATELQSGVDGFKKFAAEISPRAETLEQAVKKATAENAGAAEFAEAKFILVGEINKYASLVSRRAKHADKLDDMRRDCCGCLAVIEKYEAELKSLAEKIKKAEQEKQALEADLAKAQLNSHAAAVRAELHDGDVCPVCGGRYGGCDIGGDTDVEKCKRVLEEKQSELAELEKRRADTALHSDRVKTEYDALERALKDTEQAVADIEAEMESSKIAPAAFEQLTVMLDGLKVAAEKAAHSAERLLKSRAEIVGLIAEHDGLKAALADHEAKIEQYRVKLGENCGKTAGKISAVRAELVELEKRIAAVEAQEKRLVGEVQAATAAVEAVEKSLATAKSDCPVDIPTFDEDGYTEKRDALDRLKKQLAENERDIAVKDVEVKYLTEKNTKLAQVRAELTERKKRVDTFDKIAEMTRGKAMLNYVAAEYIAEFTSVASEILAELSRGKYTMTYDSTNGFTVYDYLNDGKARKTDTLSGGELFLASLSVAIAIARTQSNGNNAFFFLDEGFGTLDEDLIDVVYSALESLSRDCLVGVITHAEALISRMPSCVTVHEATDLAGSRIEQ